MTENWTFGRKVALGFAAAALVLAALAGVGYQSTHHLIENDGLVSHTQQVRREIADLLSQLKDAEIVERDVGADLLIDGRNAKSLPRLRAELHPAGANDSVSHW